MRGKPLRVTGVAITALMALAFWGCSSKPSDTDVMAKVNGKKILRSDVDKYYNEQIAGAPQQPTEEQAEGLRLNILKDLIDKAILAQRAEKLGLLATDDEVERKLNELKAGFTAEEFDKRLKDQHLTVDEVKNRIRQSITLEKVLNKEITSRIEVKDSDVAAYYNAHKAEFNLIEPQYHVAHIMVTPSPQPPPRNMKNDKAQNDAEAKKKIQMLMNRLDSGEDFATVAMNYSEDPSTSANGGDLGNIPESGLKGTDPATRDAVMKLKPGQYSGIISAVDPETHRLAGYRIVKLIEKAPAGQRDLNNPQVQQFIRDQLRERREQLLRSAYLDVVHNEAKVENYYAANILKNSGQKP